MKQYSFSATFMTLGIVFCTCLILSNLLAAKIFMLGSFALPAAVCFISVFLSIVILPEPDRIPRAAGCFVPLMIYPMCAHSGL